MQICEIDGIATAQIKLFEQCFKLDSTTNSTNHKPNGEREHQLASMISGLSSLLLLQCLCNKINVLE